MSNQSWGLKAKVYFMSIPFSSGHSTEVRCLTGWVLAVIRREKDKGANLQNSIDKDSG
jgi:hypothetical protein